MQTNVLAYLEHSAACFPQKTALEDETTCLTFQALWDQGRRVGTALARKIGGHNRPVAVLAGRNAATVLAFLGVLYSGNYYVPVDRNMPRQRMERLLQRLAPAALLYAGDDKALAESLSPAPVSLRESAQIPADGALLSSLRRRVLDVDPAYVIFTSGSTGEPKGIVVSHRSVIDFTDWYVDTMGIGPADVLGNQAPFFFDLSVKDLYTGLKSGASVYILPKKCFLFPTLLIQALNDHQVTTLSWAASAFHLAANSGVLEKHVPQTLKRVILGGEALQAKQLNRWRRALPQVQYVNVYGPTEVTVDCTYYFIDREFGDTETIPIGRACANKELLLLDKAGRPVPQGQPGEICVRGSGLASGYFDDPDKTAEVFIQNPLNPHYRDILYRTGDIAVEGEDGNFRFLARKDNQIKHAGYRIELGEVEAAVNSLPDIQAAVCLFDEGRDKIVCVYQGAASGQTVAAALRELLPRYMLPNLYRPVAEMPYTANGKIDRVQLRRDYDGTNSIL